MHQAARQGKWVNGPKFGCDLLGGAGPNADAPTVRRIFDLRAEGLSYKRIEELTGVNYSTVRAIGTPALSGKGVNRPGFLGGSDS